MIYPDDEPREEIHSQTHPTICLSDYREQPEGILLYEGYENFSDIRIEKKSLQIGHSDDSDVVITKDTISRYHARIECENQEFFLEDLNSTNGTFVNEEPLEYKEKRKLKTNDMIRFADVKYRFV
jgi:pSer/pThr/pTyr-binding forkhead associated (FHA) protein